MRLFASLIIFMFAFGLVEFPLSAGVETAPTNGCCCSAAATCSCGHSEGAACMMYSSGEMDSHSVSGQSDISPAFKAFGCGTNPGHKTLPSFAKDFYLGVFTENHFNLLPDILFNLSVLNFNSLPITPLEIPPKAFFRIS